MHRQHKDYKGGSPSGVMAETHDLPTAEGETLNADCTPRVCINTGCGNYTTARSRGCRACFIRAAHAAVGWRT